MPCCCPPRGVCLPSSSVVNRRLTRARSESNAGRIAIGGTPSADTPVPSGASKTAETAWLQPAPPVSYFPAATLPRLCFAMYVDGVLSVSHSGHADSSTLSKNTTYQVFFAGRPSNAHSTAGIRWKLRVSAPRQNSPAKASADRCCHADTNAYASVSTAESRIPRSRRR